MTRVLLVDDDEDLCKTLETGLRSRSYHATHRTSGEAALEALETDDVDVVVADLNMRGMNGIALCERIAASRPDVPVIVLTAFGSFDTAVSAIRAGAYDFLSKPIKLDVLAIAIARAAQHRALREEVRRLRRAVEAKLSDDELLGQSSAMRQLKELLQRVADSEASVLVTGETGTGKEVIARALHRASRRAKGPFVAVNCAAMPEQLLESELFGHVRGAFTDAKEARQGLFRDANGGTVFLDEVGDMPLGLQAKLLRVLQERTVRPVGQAREVPIDVRVVAATNRDLTCAIDEKRFREDLYFRINVVHVELPPLRSRGGDVLLLAQHFLLDLAKRTGKPITSFSAAAAERMVSYDWPGNVRELHNCIERAVALARFEQVGTDDLPEKIVRYSSAHVVVAGDDPSELVTMEEVERRYVLRVLQAVQGNKAAAARVLGFERRTLYRKLERYGVAATDDDGDGEPR